MFDEELEIKIGPAKCFLNTLGYTMSEELNEHYEYTIYDEKEKPVGCVYVRNTETNFRIDSEDLTVFGHYSFDRAMSSFKAPGHNVDRHRHYWDIDFIIGGPNVNDAYLNGQLNLTTRDYNEKGYIYDGHLEFKTSSPCYQKPVSVSMMCNGGILIIDDMVDKDDNEDSLRISFYTDYFGEYASHTSKKTNPDNTSDKVDFSIYAENSVKCEDGVCVDNYGEIKSIMKITNYDKEDNEIYSDAHVHKHPRYGIDESQEEYDNKALIIHNTAHDMLAAVGKFDDSISTDGYHILHKFAGLLYKNYTFEQILLATTLNKEDIKYQNEEPKQGETR